MMINERPWNKCMMLTMALALLATAGCAKRQKEEPIPVRTTAVLDPAELPADKQEDVGEMLAPYREEVSAEWDKVIGNSEVELKVEARRGSLGNFVADATLAQLNETLAPRRVDAVFVNSGGIRTTVPTGEVSFRKIAELLPFENTMVVFPMSGTQVRQLAGFLLEQEGSNPVSGMTLMADREGKLAWVEVGGKRVDNSGQYLIATNSYLASGEGGFVFLKDMPQEDTGILLRDLVADHVRGLNAKGQSITEPQPPARYFFPERTSTP